MAGGAALKRGDAGAGVGPPLPRCKGKPGRVWAEILRIGGSPHPRAGGFPFPPTAPALNLPLPKHPRPGERGGVWPCLRGGQRKIRARRFFFPGGDLLLGRGRSAAGSPHSRVPFLPRRSMLLPAAGLTPHPPPRGSAAPPQHCVLKRGGGRWHRAFWVSVLLPTGLPSPSPPPRHSLSRDGGLRGAKCRGNGSIFLSVDENRSVQKFLL